MITKELAIDMEDGDGLARTGNGEAPPLSLRELRAENKRLWKLLSIRKLMHLITMLAAIIVMHELVFFLLVLKIGSPNISITASPINTITNTATVSPTNTNTVGATPIKVSPTMQNAVSPTLKQMLEVGLARLPKIPVGAQYKARRGADEHMILEHMAAQGLVPHWTPAKFISRGITSGPAYDRAVQLHRGSRSTTLDQSTEFFQAASGRNSTWDRM